MAEIELGTADGSDEIKVWCSGTTAQDLRVSKSRRSLGLGVLLLYRPVVMCVCPNKFKTLIKTMKTYHIALQPRAFGFLNRVDPLVSVSNYYIDQ